MKAYFSAIRAPHLFGGTTPTLPLTICFTLPTHPTLTLALALTLTLTLTLTLAPVEPATLVLTLTCST